MRLKTLLLSSTAFWLLAAAPASAAPVVAAVTAFAGFLGSGTIGAIIVKGAIGFALNAGMSLYAKAKAKKAAANQAPRGVNVQVRLGEDNPASFVPSTYATPGVRNYAGSWGQIGKTPRAFFVDVIELGCMPLPGLAGMWAGDKKCTILWDQPHPGGLGCPVQEFRVNGTDYMWVKFADGTQTTADPYLVEKFGGHPDRPYLSTMIGRGCPWAAVTTRINADLYPSGKPDYLFETLPMVWYDLRKDSSVGGDGPQRWNDRSTWAPSDNNAVIIYNIIRGIYYGSEWVFGGQNLAAFRLPASNWMAAANECDRLITKADGTKEKQFRFGYEIRCDMEPLDVIDEARKGCNGQIAECGGIFKMLVGAPGSAVYSFTDAHIVVTSPQQLEPFRPLEQTHNAIEATYPEPAEKWVIKDAPARRDPGMLAADNNIPSPMGMSFPATPFATQVQRLMEAILKDGRRFAVHSINLPPESKVLEPNDVVAWTSAHNGYTNKKFLITRRAGTAGGRQQFLLKEIDPTDHGWTPSMELPTSIGHVGPEPVTPQPMEGWAAAPAEILDESGTARRPAIRIACAADLDDVARVHVQVRLKSTQAILFDSDQTPYPRPHSGGATQWTLSGAWCMPNQVYEVMGRYIPYTQRPTLWGAPIEVRTPDVRDTDIRVGLGQTDKDVRARFRELQDEMDSFFRPTIEQMLQDLSSIGALGQVQRQRMIEQIGSAFASISEERSVRVTAQEATARILVTLEAALGDANARIAREELARATVDQALTTSIVAAESRFDAAQSTTLARLVTEEETRASAVQALSQSLQGVSADLDGRFAQGLMTLRAAANQSGVDARFSIMLRGGTGANFKESGFYLELYTVGGVQRTRIAMMADQFVFTNGGESFYPVVIEGGVLKLAVAHIGSIRAGEIRAENGKYLLVCNTGTHEWYE
ncbi:hypothetical protein [Ensifer canadensis]